MHDANMRIKQYFFFKFSNSCKISISKVEVCSMVDFL